MTGAFPSSVYSANAGDTLGLEQYYHHSGESECLLGANEEKFVLFKSGGYRILYGSTILYRCTEESKIDLILGLSTW
jgi:hypothetical protein